MAWAPILSGWLMPRANRRDPFFVGYLRAGLAKNKPWDRFAREMLVAAPGEAANQYAGYFLSYRKAALGDSTIAGEVGAALFGVNLRCAQCHDHPHVKQWTRERSPARAAFSAPPQERPAANAPNQKVIAFAEKPSGELEYLGPDGKKKAAAMVFLDGTVVPQPAAGGRREALARVALDPKSPYFKRAMVNRVWQRLMGGARVEPVDMMHENNPATHPELLDVLAEDFAKNGFDLRRLIAVIMHTEAYARSSRWPGTTALPAETLYAVAVLK